MKQKLIDKNLEHIYIELKDSRNALILNANTKMGQTTIPMQQIVCIVVVVVQLYAVSGTRRQRSKLGIG